MTRKLAWLAATAFAVALATAVYWNATTFCADCRNERLEFTDVDNILRLLGEEGAVAGILFFLGGLAGLFLGRSLKEPDHG